MIRARAAAMVGFSASASRSAVERSIEYSPAGRGTTGGDGTGTFRSSCLVSCFSPGWSSTPDGGLAWEGPRVVVEVSATAGSRAALVTSGDWSRAWAATDGVVRAALDVRSVAQPEQRTAEVAQRRTTIVAIELRAGRFIASALAFIGCPLVRVLDDGEFSARWHCEDECPQVGSPLWDWRRSRHWERRPGWGPVAPGHWPGVVPGRRTAQTELGYNR